MLQPLKALPVFELMNPSDLRERDIDLLLREELCVSDAFQQFFFSLLGVCQIMLTTLCQTMLKVTPIGLEGHESVRDLRAARQPDSQTNFRIDTSGLESSSTAPGANQLFVILKGYIDESYWPMANSGSGGGHFDWTGFLTTSLQLFDVGISAYAAAH